jgi:hypothetical protein
VRSSSCKARQRICFPPTLFFLSGRTNLTPCGQYALARVTEAMLAPRIMQAVIEPESGVSAPASEFALQCADTVQRALSNVGFTQKQPSWCSPHQRHRRAPWGSCSGPRNRHATCTASIERPSRQALEPVKVR